MKKISTLVSSFLVCFMGINHIQLKAQTQTIGTSYIISKNVQGKIMARDANTGEILFSGDDTAKIINKAIQSIPEQHGGEIRIRAGEYEINESIVIDRHAITISGDGRKTSTYGGVSYLRSSKDIDMLIIRMDGERIRGVTIRDISFKGSGRSNGKSGIHAIGCSDLMVISNVGVYECETGIYLQGGAYGAVDAAQLQFIDPQQCGRGLVLEYCHYTKVFGGEFSDNYCESLPQHLQNGIYLTGNEFGQTTGTKIIGITSVRSAGSGILIDKGSNDISVQGGCDLGGNGNYGLYITNEVSGEGLSPTSINVSGLICYNNKKAGIMIDKGDYVLVSGCVVSVNNHPHVNNAGQDYGIQIGPEAKGVMINGNMIYNNSKKSVYDLSKNAKVTNNF